jgi:hypothetical protein
MTQGRDPREPDRHVLTVDLGGGRCPYRGWTRGFDRPLLDERCPKTVPVQDVVAEDLAPDPSGSYKRIGVTVSAPMAQLGSYCLRCLDEHTRETEAGMGVRREREVVRGGRRRGRR